METTSVFSEAFKNIIGDVITTVQLEGNEKEIKRDSSPADEWSSSNDKKSCSYCRVQFPDSQVQREHYKLDWHRYNLKQSLFSRPPITEDDFSIKTGTDDLSSISGSDSEKEDTLDTYATAQGKIFLKNKSNQVMSLYKCLMLDRKEEISEECHLKPFEKLVVTNQQWTILMLGRGDTLLGLSSKAPNPFYTRHIHCYTVRASQWWFHRGARDNKSGGSQPKSAGASLRRYNEQALVQWY
ncbi:tRNA endonuclease ANKZF1-like [Diabrotica undecimpunctata]|uniref:tRNA endonuclease ANKZF1-like n=1 Tax=Diabrotica undecimpunctata TaxID=50387 RepID=UPI003B63FE3F